MKIKRVGLTCLTWDLRRVEFGDEIEVDDDLGRVLVERGDGWEDVSKRSAAKTAKRES